MVAVAPRHSPSAALRPLALARLLGHPERPAGHVFPDVYRHHWPGLATADEANAAIDVLEAAGWVRAETMETGGRPTDVLRLHPELRGGADG